MILFDHVSIRYEVDAPEVLHDVNLSLDDGHLVLVAGRTGTGKSTLLGAMNGHVPHFTGGILSGSVVVDGHDTSQHKPRDLAHVVGVVSQDPLAGFVTDRVEEELAYSMEQLGVDPAVMRTRVEETLDILGLAELRHRPLRTLSGGQQQRVAIGSVLAAGVRVLVLDEPTSALDPVSSEEVLACLLRLVHDLGLTVVIAEHRLERVVGYADQMILLDGQGGVIQGSPADIMDISPLVPPVVDLGRRVREALINAVQREDVSGGMRCKPGTYGRSGPTVTPCGCSGSPDPGHRSPDMIDQWFPIFPEVPLTVRDARQMAASVGLRLMECDPDVCPRIPGKEPVASVTRAHYGSCDFAQDDGDSGIGHADPAILRAERSEGHAAPVILRKRSAVAQTIEPRDAKLASYPRRLKFVVGAQRRTESTTDASHQGLTATGIRVMYGRIAAVKDVSVDLPAGQITVLMGRNGSGKSSLLWALTGVLKTTSGKFSVNGTALEKLGADKVRDLVRLVPQTAGDLLYLPTVEQECSAADQENEQTMGTCQNILDTLAPGIDPASHPRDLSEGQKLCLVLAIQLTAQPVVILLDEPTRGLDYPAKAALAGILAQMASDGRTVGMVTHDVEFAAEVADRIIVMAGGEVIQVGVAAEVLGTSALFAPQTAKVFYPQRWLTPYQVGYALESADINIPCPSSCAPSEAEVTPREVQQNHSAQGPSASAPESTDPDTAPPSLCASVAPSQGPSSYAQKSAVTDNASMEIQ